MLVQRAIVESELPSPKDVAGVRRGVVTSHPARQQLGAPSGGCDDGAATCEVSAAVQRLLPTHATHELREALFGPDEAHVSLTDADWAKIANGIVRPLRLIIDRGGKGMRGQAMELCCRAVGGSFDRFGDWAAFSELIHAGSLIVDDVEDAATIRRGGPACHVVFGTARSINSGTLAYLLPQLLIERAELPPETKLSLYQEHMSLLRVCHIGQNLDLMGLRDQLDNGATPEALQQALDNVHRYKSGWAFRGFARIGAILGGGSGQQRDALGEFFLALGIAFQRVDDILDVSGCGGYKSRGGDVRGGKVTYPLVQALKLLNGAEREHLRRHFAAAETSDESVTQVLNMLETCGALDACRNETRRRVENAWDLVSTTLPTGSAREALHRFAFATLERFY